MIFFVVAVASSINAHAQCTTPGSVNATPSVICAGSTSSLTATSVGNSINWYTVPVCGVPIGTCTSGGNFTVSPVNTTTFYAESFSGATAGGTVFLNYTGCPQQIIIPNGVSQVTVSAFGAQGSAGGASGPAGALGGAAAGVLTVTAGQVLNIYVGGQGTVPTGGYNGGGTGGISISSTGGGGGGATDIRIGGAALANRVLVAGGGGAGGGNTTYNPTAGAGGGGTICGGPNGYGGAGAGGCSSGAAGGCAGGTAPNYGSGGGGGGLNTGGGGGGFPAATTGGYGCAGVLGAGGDGGGTTFICGGATGGVNGGGGGGGGFYGGGGGMTGTGGCNGGGGGGASYANTATLTSTSFTSGIQSGNGQVIIIGISGGCVSGGRTPITVTVNPSPTVAISGPTNSACPGTNVSLSANGATTYTWNTGATTTSIAASPTITTTYTVIGTTANCSNQSVYTVSVLAVPSITASTSNTLICGPPFQQTSTLTAAGLVSYTWTPGGTGTNIAVSPSVTTAYTIVGTAANGCTTTSVFTQSVSTCTGIQNINKVKEIVVYPNPNHGEFSVELNSFTENTNLEIYNTLGALVLNMKVTRLNFEINISEMAKGIYVLKVKENNIVLKTEKIVKD